MPVNDPHKFHINLPYNVRRIIGILEANGHEAYAVGGCVRDTLIGLIPGDWDITTSARPEQIKRCFRRTVDTGIAHGTVTVLMGGGAYEVTTYRIDGDYSDHRHPDSVRFSTLLEEDLKRRDFTINAMAYSDRSGVVDLFEGMDDLRRGVIRCVGRADERFTEDALRLLRAVRFAAQLDFKIERKTCEALIRHAPEISAVSKERVLAELTKLICSDHIEKIKDIFDFGLSGYISAYMSSLNIEQLFALKFGSRKFPDGFTEPKNTYYNNNGVVCGINDTDTLSANAFDLGKTTAAEKRYIRFAFLAEGSDPVALRKLLRDLRADNHTVDGSYILADRLFNPLPSDRYELKKYISGMTAGLFDDLLRLKESSEHTDLYRAKTGREDLAGVRELYEDILAKREPVYLKDLAVSGGDLMKTGMGEGPQVGRKLRQLLDYVWKHPEHNERRYLLEHVVHAI